MNNTDTKIEERDMRDCAHCGSRKYFKDMIQHASVVRTRGYGSVGCSMTFFYYCIECVLKRNGTPRPRIKMIVGENYPSN